MVVAGISAVVDSVVAVDTLVLGSQLEQGRALLAVVGGIVVVVVGIGTIVVVGAGTDIEDAVADTVDEAADTVPPVELQIPVVPAADKVVEWAVAAGDKVAVEWVEAE